MTKHALAARIAILIALITTVLTAGAGSQAAPTQSPFAEEIHAFAVDDEIYPKTGCETLLVGSSSFRFWTRAQQDFPDWRIIRRGFGGAQISDINANFDRVVAPYRPARILFYAGENDINAGRTPEQVLAEFETFLARKDATLGVVPVFVLAAKPSPARLEQLPRQAVFNSLLANLASKRPELRFVDIATPMMRGGAPDPTLFISDGLHMKAAGYAIWREVIRKAIRKAGRGAAKCR